MQKDVVPVMLWNRIRTMSGAVRKYGTPYRGALCCGVLVLLMACLLPVTSYGIMLKMDNTELVAQSDVVIYGTVEEIHAKNHVREAIIKIHTVLKGTVSTNDRLRVAFSPALADSPTFVTTERVLLFLKAVDSSTFQTVGGFQGKVSFE